MFDKIPYNRLISVYFVRIQEEINDIPFKFKLSVKPFDMFAHLVPPLTSVIYVMY